MNYLLPIINFFIKIFPFLAVYKAGKTSKEKEILENTLESKEKAESFINTMLSEHWKEIAKINFLKVMKSDDF